MTASALEAGSCDPEVVGALHEERGWHFPRLSVKVRTGLGTWQ